MDIVKLPFSLTVFAGMGEEGLHIRTIICGTAGAQDNGYIVPSEQVNESGLVDLVHASVETAIDEYSAESLNQIVKDCEEIATND